MFLPQFSEVPLQKVESGADALQEKLKELSALLAELEKLALELSSSPGEAQAQGKEEALSSLTGELRQSLLQLLEELLSQQFPQEEKLQPEAVTAKMPVAFPEAAEALTAEQREKMLLAELQGLLFLLKEETGESSPGVQELNPLSEKPQKEAENFLAALQAKAARVEELIASPAGTDEGEGLSFWAKLRQLTQLILGRREAAAGAGEEEPHAGLQQEKIPFKPLENRLELAAFKDPPPQENMETAWQESWQAAGQGKTLPANSPTAAARGQGLPLSSQELFTQLVQKVQHFAARGQQEIRVQLKPEFLGRVIIKVSKADGVLTAKVLAEQLAVREMLESNFQELRQRFQQAGLEVDEIRVMPQAGEGSFYEEEHRHYFQQEKRQAYGFLPQAPAAGEQEAVTAGGGRGSRGQVDYFV